MAAADFAGCFSQAQNSATNHRKNALLLHKAFLAQADITSEVEPGRIRLTGEKAFADGLKNMIDRILQVKKGIVQGDRAGKFLTSFIAFALERALPETEVDEDEELEDTPASRLVAVVLKHLLKALPAKDKTIRFRACQLVAMMTNGLGELDDDIHRALTAALLDRARDKEASVRSQAIVALYRLQSADSEENEYGETPMDVILDALEHDPSAEVRRVALLQLEPQPDLVPYIIRRARDVDPINRRAVFSVSLADLAEPYSVTTLQQREELIRAGLKDREPNVRKAAAKLVSTWADHAGGLVQFLSYLDVVDGKVAEDALKALFDSRADLVDALDFGEEYWTTLTPESIFLIRSFAAYCQSVKDDARLDECMPVVTALAFRMEAAFNELVQSMPPEPEDLNEEERVALVERVFVVKELLRLAVLMDYADENGRRKTFGLIRDMISHTALPLELLPFCLDVLLKLSNGERDFLQVVVEVVQIQREDANIAGSAPQEESEEESDDDALVADALTTPARKQVQFATPTIDSEKAPTHLRCLAIVKALLERILGALSDNSMFVGLVHELIVPSVRCKVPEIREQGMICLGLCSLLDKNMALDSFGLFVNQSQSAEGDLKIRVYEIVFDVLMLYGVDFLSERGHGPDRVIEFLLHALQEASDIQAIAAVGIAKLMLSGMVTDTGVLADLVLIYFAPETTDNAELRQCLSYFFPVYCYSSPANQRRMQQIVLSTLEILSDVYDDPATEKDEMVAPTQIALQLVDWTDPTKAVCVYVLTNKQPRLNEMHSELPGQATDDQVHVALAVELLKGVYSAKRKEDRKLYCQHLAKLHFPEKMADIEIRAIILLIESIQEDRPLTDATSRTALTRFETTLRKKYAGNLEPLGDEELASLEEHMRAWQGVGEFLDGERATLADADQDFEIATTVKGGGSGGRKSGAQKTPARRLKASTASSTSGTKGKGKRARSVSLAPTEATVDDEEDGGTIRRSTRARRTIVKEEIVEESDGEELPAPAEDDGDEDAQIESSDSG